MCVTCWMVLSVRSDMCKSGMGNFSLQRPEHAVARQHGHSSLSRLKGGKQFATLCPGQSIAQSGLRQSSSSIETGKVLQPLHLLSECSLDCPRTCAGCWPMVYMGLTAAVGASARPRPSRPSCSGQKSRAFRLERLATSDVHHPEA